MIGKLRTKLIVVCMLSLFAVLFFIIGVSCAVSYRQLVSEADHTLDMLGANGGDFPKGREPFKRAPELPFESRFFSVRLSDDGEFMGIDMKQIVAIDQATGLKYARSVQKSGRMKGFIGNYRYAVRNIPGGKMVLFLDCRRNLSSFRNFFITSLLTSLFGMGAVLILIIFFSKRIVRPVMESYEKQRRFITDAGHEIKTPLAIINSNADVLELDFGSNEWLTEIKNQTKRLTTLTNDLISLSRMEEAQAHLEMEPLSFSELTENMVHSFQGMAAQQEKEFTVHTEPGLMVCGDKKSLERLLTILLDNALKYCPAHGRIDLTLERCKKQICLKLTNTAEQIDPSELPHLFERFYRTDRSRNSETGGYGIGLSIASAVAAAHKGKIAASTKDGYSLTVTLLLPSA